MWSNELRDGLVYLAVLNPRREPIPSQLSHRCEFQDCFIPKQNIRCARPMVPGYLRSYVRIF